MYEKRLDMNADKIKELEEQVNKIFRKSQYNDDKDYIDVISIAQNLGFEVGNAMIEEDMDGFILINENQGDQENQEKLLGIQTDKLIGVNSKRPIEWKRFIIAHELGHYMLDYVGKNNNGMFAHREHKKGRSERENEIDFFAASLLMPKEKFKKEYIQLKNVFLEY